MSSQTALSVSGVQARAAVWAAFSARAVDSEPRTTPCQAEMAADALLLHPAKSERRVRTIVVKSVRFWIAVGRLRLLKTATAVTVPSATKITAAATNRYRTRGLPVLPGLEPGPGEAGDRIGSELTAHSR